MDATKTFMIVEDDPDDLYLFKEALAIVDPSIRCTHADDGRKALELLNDPGNKLPDLIFMSINMPLMNGLECLAEIRRSRWFDHIPVLMYTCSASQQDKDHAKALGAAGFITKPTSFDRLCAVLSGVVAGELVDA